MEEVKKIWLILAVLVAVSLIVVSCAKPTPTPTAKPPEKQLWTFGTTSSASGYYAIEVAFAKLINKYVPEVKCTPIETGATVDNNRRMEKGELQIAFGSGSADYQGYKGIGPFKGKPLKKPRLCWIFHYPTFNYVVRADSGIKTIYDLEGKKLNIGIPGSTTAELAEWCMKLLGIHPIIERSATKDAIEAMKDGRIDAWCKGAFNPDSAILTLMATTKINILSFSDEDLAKLHADRPYVVPAVVKADVYKGIPQFKTYAVYVDNIISADVPQELQYKVIKAVYEHYDEILAAFPRLKPYGDILEMTVSKACTPLAAGTVQYLKEKGYTVPKELIPPEYKE